MQVLGNRWDSSCVSGLLHRLGFMFISQYVIPVIVCKKNGTKKATVP